MSITAKGFSLVELLIALAVSGIIMTGVYSAFKTQQDSYLAQDQVAEMQQNIRAGFYVMLRDLRMAGYDPTQSSNFGITTATASKLVFTADGDADGIVNVPPANGETFTYELYPPTGGVKSLRRIASGSAVAENIGELEFLYTLEDGTKTLTPTVVQLPLIRSVQVSILAITAHQDRKYTNNQPYAPASASAVSSGVDWTPSPPDHFRRRFQTMTVKCRNMGL